MKSKWETVELSEVADLTVGFVGTMASHYTDDGVLFLRSTNIEPFDIKMDDVKYISRDFHDTIKKSQLNENDVVIVRTGKPGACTVIPRKTEPWNCSDLVIIRPNQNELDPIFLASYINLASGVINAHLVGAVQQHFNVGAAKKMEIPLPSISEQRRIASIIRDLNNKIKINRKINDNLQQQAQALFEQRFIVEDIEGEEKPLYDFADYINGAAFKPSECGDQGLPIIKIAELKNGITDSTKYFDGFKGEKYLVHDKDILFSWSGNPDTSIDIFIWTHGKAILNQHTFNVKSNTGHRWFTFLMLKYFRPEFSRIASNKQTTGLGHVTASDLKRLTFISNEAAIEVFEHEVSPFMETIYSNMMENQRLAQLRDSLLPKLMSGEIDVSGIQT